MVPSNSKEIERSALASMLTESSVMEVGLEELKKEDFYNSYHSQIFSVFEKAAKTMPIENISYPIVEQFLEEDAKNTYYDLFNAATVTKETLREYVKILKNHTGKRKMHFHGIKIRDMSLDPEADFDGILSFNEKELMQITDGGNSSKTFHIRETLMPVIESIEKVNKGVLPGIPTGIKALDNLTGGIVNKQLIIIAARPGMGKSSLASTLALHFSNLGLPVYESNLEMGEEEITKRRIAAIGRIDKTKFQKGGLQRSDMEKFHKACSVIHDSVIYLNPNTNIDVYDLRIDLMRQKRLLGIKIAIIDYLQLMKNPLKGVTNKAQQISETARMLKLMAKELGIPIIALSQLNRGLENRPEKRPSMSDLKESGGIEENADQIWMIYRGAKYGDERNGVKIPEEETEILCRKNRDGQTGTAFCNFFGQYCLFEDMKKQQIDDMHNEETIW